MLTVLLAESAAVGGPRASPQDQARELAISVTAISPSASAILGESSVPRGPTGVFITEEPLAFRVTAPAGERREAILLINEAASGAGVATLVHDRAGTSLALRAGAALAVDALLDAEPGATLDVFFSESGAGPLLLVVGRPALATILLTGPGAIRVQATATGATASVGQGEARVHPGGVPADGPGALADGVTLRAQADNSITIAADGTLGAPGRVEDALAGMNALRGAIVQRSLLTDLVKVAEETTEGDIEPPTRGAQIPAVAVAPQVRIPEFVPRGGLAVQVLAGARGFPVSTVQSTAEAFIGSGDAALAVVGSRLIRTRVVAATPGTGGVLAINREILRLFTIGPRP